MRPGLAALSTLVAVAILALTSGCGGGPSTTPRPSAPGPSASPIPQASLGQRVTFYGADAGDGAGALAAGDFNGDTELDVVLAAALADGPQNARPDAGEAYLFLGPFVPGEERDAAALQYDLVIYGAHDGDQLGRALTMGDFDGDGIDDIALGAPFADGPRGEQPDAGQVYLLLGSGRIGNQTKEIDLAAGAYDAIIFGADPEDLAGFALHAADVNGDGPDDLIIGAFQSDGPNNDRPDSGEVYVVYGGSVPRQIDLAAGDQDATVQGAEAEDWLSQAVGAGDVNGDGTADLIVVATFADGPDNDREKAGETYVILGPPPPIVDVAREQQTLTVLGIDPGDQLGHSVAAGDTNGDGFADILLGAVSADGPGNREDLAGEAVLISGGGRLPEVIDTAAQGAASLISGAAPGDRLGGSVAMGDVNGDGLSDLLMAARDVDARDGADRVGAVYVFYGRTHGPYPPASSGADLVLLGLDTGDALTHENFGTPSLLATDVNGDGLADILVTAPAADGPGDQRLDSGEAYLILTERQGQGSPSARHLR